MGVLVIFTWTSVFAITYFLAMKIFGLLRIDKTSEIIGSDLKEMGGLSASDWKVI